MVAAGLVAMLIAEHAPYLPSLMAIPIEGSPLRRNVQLLAVAGRQYSPALDAFIKVARVLDWQAEIGISANACPLSAPSLAGVGDEGVRRRFRSVVYAADRAR
jgi:hypothetical protein